MRALVLLLAGCLVMTACGYKSHFEGDVRFKVVEVRSDGYKLVLAEEQPVGMVSDWYAGWVLARHFAEPVAVDDEVVCHIVQQRVDEKGISTRTEESNCRKV